MTSDAVHVPHLICRGSIYHERLTPVRHGFTYPVFFFAFDLDQLRTMSSSRLIRYNRPGLFSMRDRDYLDDANEPLAAKCRRFMPVPVDRVIMITVPRLMGYAFNPVTFYLGMDKDGAICAAVAEVNNTFHERHVYALADAHMNAEGFTVFRTSKAFHVSPFNDRRGDYVFRVRKTGERIEIHVDIDRDGQMVFRSGLIGTTTRPVSSASLLLALIRYPLQNLQTLPRIHWQALKLYVFKKLPYYPKPGPNSPMTIRIAPPSLLEKLGMRIFLKLSGRLKKGRLIMKFPDGRELTFGDAKSETGSELLIRDYTFFRRILLDGDIGLGEAYMYGQWDSPDLTGFLCHIIENRDELENGEFLTTRIKRWFHRISHRSRSNTKPSSRRNIRAHYDLSNDFFKLFLDPTMMYSAAVFREPGQSLEEAQHHRMELLIDKLQIDASHHVLEIGSGWGGFAIEMATRTGCRVTSITISDEQLKLARDRVRQAGLEDRVAIEHCDYRDVAGRFDRVVSIEMLEAVGHEHFDSYFAAINRALAPDGRAVLQVITIPASRYEAYLSSVDWIQKHIFPGGHLPCIEALEASMKRVSNLVITGAEDIGEHYARTLRHWSLNLAARKPELMAMGYDDVFYRKWQYYFSYCEAAFATRTLSDMHLVLERSH